MRKPAKSFQDLLVWQEEHRFVLAAYSLTKSFPKSEEISKLLDAYSRSILTPGS